MAIAGPPFGKLALPIVKYESGAIRPVSGAQVYVYKTLANGSAPVDAAGNVNGSAVEATIWSDRGGSSTLTQPLTSDSLGYINGYSSESELHFKVVQPDGTTYGVVFYPHNGVGTLKPSLLDCVNTGLTIKTNTVSFKDVNGNYIMTTGAGQVSTPEDVLFTPGHFQMPTTAPTNPVEGSFYWDLYSSGQILIYDGTSWKGVTPS